MATLHQLLAAVQGQISLVTTGVSYQQIPIQVDVGIHWPPVRTLQTMVKMRPPGALISVFDRKSAHDSTRWIPSVSAITVNPTTLTAAPARQIIPAGGKGVITVAAPVSPGDAMALVLHSYGPLVAPNGSPVSTSLSEVISPDTTASSSDVAALMAAAVAADPAGPIGWATVTASGPVLTITNTSTFAFFATVNTGSGGSQITEIARRMRDIQITIWAPNDEIGNVVADPVESMIAQIETFRGRTGEYNAGLALQDGTFARVRMVNDFMLDDAVLSDAYRRDMIFSADYGVTTQDQLFSILSQSSAYQNSTTVPLPVPPPDPVIVLNPSSLDFSDPANSMFIGLF